MAEKKCIDCQYYYLDERPSVYARPKMAFCRKKGRLFSRNFKVGEQTRIDPGAVACPEFEEKEKHRG